MAEEKLIWEYLSTFIGNGYGAAGLMGNLRAESGLEPVCLEMTYRKKLGMTSEEYTGAVDDGSYRDFVSDGAGYGLAQWTYFRHKDALLSYARVKGMSVGDLKTQLEFLELDLRQWDYVLGRLRVARMVREASDLVLTVYLKPADRGQEAMERRARLGEEIFERYGKGGVGMTVKAEDLVKLFRQALDEGWGYIWGTYGQVWTQRDQDNANREQTVLYGQKWVGRRVADCSGLGYWAFRELGGRMYHGSNTMWQEYVTGRTALVNGRRADGGEIYPGDPVFMVREADGEKVRHHVGYYVGGGQVIEAKGTASGVVAGLVDRWQETAHWVNVEYPGGVVFRMRNTLRKGSSGMEVRDLQELLTGAGYPLEADGVFGAKTEAAVRAFQADHGLTTDGICGKNTWAVLEPDITDTPEQPDRLLLIRDHAQAIIDAVSELRIRN